MVKLKLFAKKCMKSTLLDNVVIALNLRTFQDYMLNHKQQTIQKAVTISGVGLHTGVQTTMTFMPAKSNHGIKFQRIDLPGSPIIEADCDRVVDVSRGTTIEQSGARVSTIEHTLAALVGLEIDNVLIQLNGPEAPIMDGSSIQFINILKEAETEEQNALRDFFEVQDGIWYREADRNVEIAALLHAVRFVFCMSWKCFTKTT